MELFRRTRKTFWESVCGPYYGGQKNMRVRNDQRINLLNIMAQVYIPVLAQPVRALVKSDQPWLWEFSQSLGAMLDFLWRHADGNIQIERCVFESLFSRGVVWVGLGPAKTNDFYDPKGYLMHSGMPTFRVLEDEDFIDDTEARNYDEIDFRGHRYRLPFDYAMECGLYNTEFLEREKNAYNLRLQKYQDPGTWGYKTPLIDFVELVDIWLPRQNVVITLGSNDQSGPVMREDTYTGPETGQYEILSYQDVPGSNIPIPPASVGYSLGTTINELVRALERQAKAFRTTYVVRPGAEQMAEDIKNAPDMSYVWGDPQSVVAITAGGVNPANFQTVNWIYDWFNKLTGNPELMGGLSESSKTVTTNQLLFGNSQTTMSQKRNRVRRFVANIMKKMAHYLWQGNMNREMMVKTDFGEFVMNWDDRREGDLFDYNIDIQPYLETADSPKEQYDRMMEIFSKIAVPLASLGAQQGDYLDVAAATEYAARRLNVPEMSHIYRKGQAPIQNASVQGVASESKAPSPAQMGGPESPGGIAPQIMQRQQETAEAGGVVKPSRTNPQPKVGV